MYRAIYNFTGCLSSSCEPAKTILLDGALVIRVSMGKFTICFSKQEYLKMLLPYFHGVLLALCPLMILIWDVFSELSLPRCFHSHLGIVICQFSRFLLLYFYFFVFSFLFIRVSVLLFLYFYQFL